MDDDPFASSGDDDGTTAARAVDPENPFADSDEEFDGAQGGAAVIVSTSQTAGM